jgi:hypothetical protein
VEGAPPLDHARWPTYCCRPSQVADATRTGQHREPADAVVPSHAPATRAASGAATHRPRAATSETEHHHCHRTLTHQVPRAQIRRPREQIRGEHGRNQPLELQVPPLWPPPKRARGGERGERKGGGAPPPPSLRSRGNSGNCSGGGGEVASEGVIVL